MLFFKSHIMIAHFLWSKLIVPGDYIIDATCGNGKDSLVLAEMLQGSGRIDLYDIQAVAIDNTKQLLANKLDNKPEIHSYHKSHKYIDGNNVKLCVYNFGYLPGGDKSIVSQSEDSIESIKKATTIIMRGGAICLTTYPGHEEGLIEHEFIYKYLELLPKEEWNIFNWRKMNSPTTPNLFWIYKK